MTQWVHKSVIEFLGKHCDVVANESRATWTRERVLAEAQECDAMMAFMPDTVNEPFLAACPRLKVVAAAFEGAGQF